MSAIFYLVLFAFIATAGITLAGNLSMAKGGQFDENYSAPLMGARVIVQGIAIGLLVIAALFWV